MTWAVYHLFFVPKTEKIYQDQPGLKWSVFMRGFSQILTFIMTAITFIYATRANVNPGVIAGLLTGEIFYTAVIFRVTWGEKISVAVICAGLLVVAGVISVGYKAENSVDAANKIESSSDLFLSIVFS